MVQEYKTLLNKMQTFNYEFSLSKSSHQVKNKMATSAMAMIVPATACQSIFSLSTNQLMDRRITGGKAISVPAEPK